MLNQFTEKNLRRPLGGFDWNHEILEIHELAELWQN